MVIKLSERRMRVIAGESSSMISRLLSESLMSTYWCFVMDLFFHLIVFGTIETLLFLQIRWFDLSVLSEAEQWQISCVAYSRACMKLTCLCLCVCIGIPKGTTPGTYAVKVAPSSTSQRGRVWLTSPISCSLVLTNSRNPRFICPDSVEVKSRWLNSSQCRFS